VNASTLPFSVSSSHIFSSSASSLHLVWFVEIYVRLYSKIIFGKSHYEGGKKYCRRCEVYYCHDGVFCPCCGMALRMSPTSKRDKERLRQSQLRREEEQGRTIRIIRGTQKYPFNQVKIYQ
jgi:hypothetical protein